MLDSKRIARNCPVRFSKLRAAPGAVLWFSQQVAYEWSRHCGQNKGTVHVFLVIVDWINNDIYAVYDELVKMHKAGLVCSKCCHL